MKRVLLLTHNFPPLATPEAYLSAKRMGNIPDARVDVVTMGLVPGMAGLDESFLPYVEARFGSVTRIEPPGFYRHMPFSRWKALFSLPDSFRWLNGMYRPYLRDLSQYDAVVTWSMYHSVHLLGPWIKHRYPHLPWIAHFSDPWTRNPFHQWGLRLQALNALMERRVVEGADLLLVTSEETKALFARDYNAEIMEKMRIVPHCFDPALYEEGARQDDCLRLCYIGHFYGPRTPLPLFDALKDLREDACLDGVKFIFVGNSELDLQKEAAARGIDALVEIRPPVKYTESLKLMKQSDALLVIDAPFESSPFLPSKLIDYIGADRPVFGISPKGASQALIEEMGFPCVSPREPAQIATRMKGFLSDLRQRRDAMAIPEPVRNRYSAAHIGQMMRGLLD